MHKQFLGAIARISCRRPRLVLGLAVFLTFLSWLPPLFSYFNGGLHAPFDLSTLLPQSVPAVRDFIRAVTDFDSVDEAVVVFHLGSAEEREPPPEEILANPELGSEGARAERRLGRERQIELAGRAADRLVDLLQADPRIQSAFCRRYLPEDRDYLIYQALPDFGLLLVGEGEIPRLRELMQPETIRRSVASLKSRLASSVSSAMALDEFIVLDALGLGAVFQRALQRYGVSASSSAPSTGGYLVDQNRSMLLVVVQPDRPAQSINFSQAVSTFIRQAAETAYQETVPEASRNAIAIEFGGGYEAAVRYTNHVNGNLFSTLLTSLAGVLCIFGVIYRRVKILFFIGLPLVMAVSWTIGIGWLLFGQLNIISAAFAAVLVALGVDYAIHIYNRYIDEYAAGQSLEDAFFIAIQNTGWGVIIGMVTTTIAFLSLLATRFSQLAEFGVLAGVGIALSAPLVLFVLPASFSWWLKDNNQERTRLRPAGLGLSRLGDWVVRHARLAFGLTLLIILVDIGALVFRPESTRFDEGIANLRPSERVFELGQEIAKAFSNRNPNSLMLLAYGASEEEAVETASRLREKCDELEQAEPGKTPILAAYESFLRYLPSPSSQRVMLASLKEMDLSAATDVFRQALLDEGLDEEFFSFTFALLQQHQERMESNRVVLPSDLKNTPLWRHVRRFVSQTRRELDLRKPLPDDLVFPVQLAASAVSRSETVKAKTGDILDRDDLLALIQTPGLAWQDQVRRVKILEPSGWVVKTSIYPPLAESRGPGSDDTPLDDAWFDALRSAFAISVNNASGKNADDVIMVGIPILSHELAGIVKQDFRQLSIMVFVICSLILMVFFHHNPLRLLWSLIPVIFGVVYLIGFMNLAGISFNFVNILVVPVIIGLGVDNGIHLTERFFESGRNTRIIVLDTGRALVVTTLTSIAGFGSLAISGYEGVASIGRLSIFGLGWILFASLITTPAILHLVYNRSEGRKDC
ncbi:MAG: MMPL family transporter [Planctomycetota bacterium]|jgi:predicted RND superfamily exporter protein|nr:MMPL family transporter [Planctomycetota bacterium]